MSASSKIPIAGLLALSTDGHVELAGAAPVGAASGDGLRERVAEYERGLVARALEETQGNQSEAARRLKVTRTTLIDKMKRYGL